MKRTVADNLRAAGELNFTPGPWHCWDDEADTYQVCWADADHEGNEDIRVIASIPKTEPYDELEPNAQLIAAAPELYESLEVCIPLLESAYLTGFSTGDVVQEIGDMLDRAKEALAKARGGA